MIRWLQRLFRRHSRPGPAIVAAYTHPGLVLEQNEDSFLFSHLPDSSVVLAAVADGLGGLEAGEIASSLVLQMLMRRWLEPDASSRMSTPHAARVFLRKAFREANAGIVRINRELSGRMLMGTTAVAAIFIENVAIVAHCGDSRCYRMRDRRLRQLTRDHTLAQAMVSQGRLRPREAFGHPLGHVLSRCLGARRWVQPVIGMHAACHGDRFLLCTDGLSSFVRPKQIAETLRTARTAESAAKRLVGQSLAAGGADNITVVTVFF